MPPLVPSFLLPQWLKDLPLPLKLSLLVPGLLLAVLGIMINAVVINLGAGNQHLSNNSDGFEEWLLWIIVAGGLALGLTVGGFVYFGVGLGADAYDAEEEEHEGETGMLEP